MTNIPHRILRPVDYKYVVTDLRNNRILGVLPFKGVSYSNMLSQPGEFSGEIQVNLDTRTFGLRENTVPGRTGLYVVREGKPIWGGIIWKRRYSAPNRALEVEASTFESYFYKRFNRLTRRWSQTDQLQIARQLTESIAADIVTTVDNKTSGRSRDRSVYAHEFKRAGEELEQLGNLIDGFDWNVVLTRGQGMEIFRHLTFFYPERGVSKKDTTLSFEYPGSISAFEFSEDADEGANRIWAIGAGDAEEQITAYAENKNGNWPPLEETQAYKSVSRKNTLQAHANSDLTRLNSPVEIAEVTVRSDIEPFLGSYEPGD